MQFEENRVWLSPESRSDDGGWWTSAYRSGADCCFLWLVYEVWVWLVIGGMGMRITVTSYNGQKGSNRTERSWLLCQIPTATS